MVNEELKGWDESISNPPQMKYYSELEDYDLQYAKDGDAGLDLPVTEAVSLNPGESALVPTGVRVELPRGYYGLLDTRSSTGAKKKVDLLCRTIDQGYRGELKLALVNHSRNTVQFEVGQRVAQLVVAPVLNPLLTRVSHPSQLSESDRGDGGFGHTGETKYN